MRPMQPDHDADRTRRICEDLAFSLLDLTEERRLEAGNALCELFRIIEELEQVEPIHGPPCRKHLSLSQLQKLLNLPPSESGKP